MSSTRSQPQSALSAWLDKAPAPVFAAYAMGVSFAAYFAMYAFRKPFAVAKFSGATWGPLELKTALVISQILGYTISKYLGIKICSEVQPAHRAATLVGLILVAEGALALFGLAPDEWKVVAIFLNGLPLGMVWGMVVGYLEGRRSSELLLAGLSCSFIVASGVVKDVGKALVGQWGVAEAWMPAATGLCFLPMFLIAVWLLHQIPRPTAADVAERVERSPMNRGRRVSFVRSFWLGLVMLFVAYFFLTAYRDFRDNYGVEVLEELGYENVSAVFTRTETPVALGVLVALASLTLVRDNRRGLAAGFAIMMAGSVLMGLATLAFDARWISGLVWMSLVGLGSYLAYVPFGSMLFDRMIASTRVVGTAVFAIYLADAIGYTGSVGVQLYKDLAHSAASRLEFFRLFTYFMAALGSGLLGASAVYFLRAAKPGAGD